MSTMAKNELRNANYIQSDKIKMGNNTVPEIHFQQQLTVSILIKTMLEIIKIKKSPSMDDETRRQFPAIAREIVFLAEHAQ